MAKISVIVPVYNTEQYLEKCLESLINQTLSDIEIIVVNDGSPDNSQEIIDKYKEKFPEKIKAVIQSNGGQSSARNNAMQYVTGEYIAFVDSDDFVELDAYEKTYNYAKDKELDVVCFGMNCIYDDGKITHSEQITKADEIDRVFMLNEAGPCNKIYKFSIWKNNNLKFREGIIYEDLELIPQIVLYTDKIGYMDECFYNYIIHSNSTMNQTKYNPKLQSIFLVMETLKERFKNSEFTQELEFLYIEHLLHSAMLRFLEFDEGKKDIRRISEIMKANFPAWYKNKYFKQQGYKYRIVCFIAYFKMISILKLLVG